LQRCEQKGENSLVRGLRQIGQGRVVVLVIT
jgi:hypothetical protein